MQVYDRLTPAKKNKFGQTPDSKRLDASNVLFRQPTQPVQVDLTDNSLWYGEDNSFPLRLATLVQESPAASSCISVITDFLEGSGFSDETLKDKIINGQKQTFGHIHSLVCESFALFEGFSLLIKYNKLGNISEIFSIPFENIRLQRPDDKGVISKVNYNPYYGTGIYQRRYTEEYDLFNSDPVVVRAQMAKVGNKYKGQVLYIAFTRPLSRFYPQPYYFSAKAWMAIDAGIGAYHENNLDAGFFQMVILKMIGNPDEPSTHPDDQETNATTGEKESIRTRGQRFNIMMQEFVGSESKTKMMVLWEIMKEQLPELQAFPTSTNDTFFTTLQNLTTKNILIAMKVPAILANMGGESSLSDGNQMANATKVMKDRVEKPQALLCRTYKTLLGAFKEPYPGEIKVINEKNFDAPQVDPLVWASLTPEEQRVWIKDNTDYPILETAPAPVATPEPVTPTPEPTNSFSNIMFKDFPETAKNNAKKALKWDSEHPGCGKPVGRQMAEDIIAGNPLTFKDIRRVYNYLKRNRGSETKLFSDSCDSLLFSMWGGVAMFEYCADKIKMINE